MSKWVESTTRRALPILIGCAKRRQTLSYRELDDEIVRQNPAARPHIGRATQWYAYVAGGIGDIIEKFSVESDELVPPLNAIIVKRDKKRLPSFGVDGYIEKYAKRALAKKMTESNRDDVAREVIRAVFDYPKWDWVARHFGIFPKKEELEQELAQAVKESRQLSAKVRQERLAKAGKIPEQVQVVSVAFKRNYDVIAEVLERANGICEECKQAAPFIRISDKTPYLEVHHMLPLARGGEDTVDNAAALCPNCHRKAHFGPSNGR